jgi:BRCT domain type II-containing protein
MNIQREMLSYRGGVTIKKYSLTTTTLGFIERTSSSLFVPRNHFSSFPYKSFPSISSPGVEGQRHKENRQRNVEGFQEEEIYGQRGFNLDEEADTLRNWRRVHQQQRQRRSPNHREEKEDPSFSSSSSSSSSTSTSHESGSRRDAKVLENEEWEKKIDRWMKDFVRMIHPDFFHAHPTER